MRDASCGEWCGLCYTNVKGRTNRRGHRGYRQPRPLTLEVAMGAVRRRTEVPTTNDPGGDYGADELALAYPVLWEFLTTSKYDDGKPRVLPSLMVFFDAPLVKACLNDRDQGLSAWVSSPGLQGALVSLERGLAGDCLDWRKPGPGGRRKR